LSKNEEPEGSNEFLNLLPGGDIGGGGGTMVLTLDSEPARWLARLPLLFLGGDVGVMPSENY